MNIGLVIGKKNSVGVPGKNIRLILGRPAAEYAFIAAKYSNLKKIYVSTDCNQIAKIGKKYNAVHIKRPKRLATPDALTEDALLHAYDFIKKDLVNKKISSISLLFCNNPAINVYLLKKAIKFINKTKDYDSCFSVVKYDMFSPARARKLTKQKEIKPFVKLDYLGEFNSIRDSQGSSYFCDLSIQVLKSTCFENMYDGQLPFRWQGKRSKAIISDFGFDIDTEWQYVVIEYWLKSKGFTEEKIPWKV